MNAVTGENYTLYHGDCLEVMPALAAGSVGAVIADPPYGIEINKSHRLSTTRGFGADVWDSERQAAAVGMIYNDSETTRSLFGGAITMPIFCRQLAVGWRGTK